VAVSAAAPLQGRWMLDTLCGHCRMDANSIHCPSNRSSHLLEQHRY